MIVPEARPHKQVVHLANLLDKVNSEKNASSAMHVEANEVDSEKIRCESAFVRQSSEPVSSVTTSLTQPHCHNLRRTTSLPQPDCHNLLKDALPQPQKNTFIHYDIPRSSSPRSRSEPSTPTASMSGILLSQFFQTEAVILTKTNNDASLDPSVDAICKASASSSAAVLSTWADITTAQKEDAEGHFEQKSTGSTRGSPSSSVRGRSMHGSSPSNTTIYIASSASTSNSSSAAGPSGQSLEKLELHNRGLCEPCNYFWYKTDGCRQGSECPFCHFCPRGEIKRRKKAKLRQYGRR
jgi:hypothetical protein